MSIAQISIRRPVLIACLVILMLAAGLLSLARLPVDQFPSVKFPYIGVTVIYPGAGPSEIVNLVSKPLEEEVRTIAGAKKVTSYNSEGVSLIYVEFTLETDPQYAEQQMRDRVAAAKSKMPKGIEEPVIRRFDPSDQAVITLAFQGESSPNDLFEITDRKIRPTLEQVPKVSQVKISGGSKREIQVLLDRKKLQARELSVSQVSEALETGGENIPLGKRPDPQHSGKELIYRSLGEFNNIESVQAVIVKFLGNDVPIRVGDLGKVIDTHKDESSLAFFNGKPSLIIEVFRQTGANTVAVAGQIRERVEKLNSQLASECKGCSLTMVRDASKPIRDNVEDVAESIVIGILLTVVVVFFFLGSLRSTIITGLALPNSLIGAFILVAAAGFSVNTITLLALSLSVGLLVDDAIVVRENIFRHIEMGKDAKTAALEGTNEVMMAVVATTLAILAVFGPIAFVHGVSAQFLKEFGLTVCFAMLISLFDALTVAPTLSARFAGAHGGNPSSLEKVWDKIVGPTLRAFNRFQTFLEHLYARIAQWTVNHAGKVLVISVILFAGSLLTVSRIPKTFLPPADTGEILVNLELPPGSTLRATEEATLRMDEKIRSDSDVALTSVIVGSDNNDPTKSQIFVRLKSAGERKVTTGEFKDRLRGQFAQFSDYRPKIIDFDVLFGNQRPFSMNLLSKDAELLETTAQKMLELIKTNPGFVAPDINYRPGKPEISLVFDEGKSKRLGVGTKLAGVEVRGQMEGMTPAKFREKGEEWDIRVRLAEGDRDLKTSFEEVLIPNINGRLVNLFQVAELKASEGPNTVYRQDGERLIEVSADIGTGYGLGDLMGWMEKEMSEKHLLPEGVRYSFEGQGEQFEEMTHNMIVATLLAILFIYLVLASLYESFFTPFALLLPLPLAISGALVALWIGGKSLNIYSIIATIMLLGIATKNSIILIDYTNQLVEKGMEMHEALVEAARTRLRPILMTSMALVAGTLPLAVGLNEASKQRSSMGWVIIGGVLSSTFLTLLVVPAALSFFRRGRKT